MAAQIKAVSDTAHSLSQLDVASSLGLLAIEGVRPLSLSLISYNTSPHTLCPQGYCKPEMVEGRSFRVENGFHPVVASQQLSTFVGNSCCLDSPWMWIVTGPNMGGEL